MNLPLFLRATRAYSFPASIVPVLLGTSLAAGIPHHPHRFDIVTFLLVLVGGVLSQAGGNTVNDYYDFKNGVDTRPEHGSGVLTDGTLTSGQMLRLTLVLLGSAAACGLLALVRSYDVTGQSVWEPVVVLALIGLACAVSYPTLLKRYGLGDLLIVITFGVGLTLGAYILQVGGRDAGWGLVVVASLPVAFLVDAILHANNMRDREDDRAAHVHTVASLLSVPNSRRLLAGLTFGPLAFVLVGTATGLLSVWSLLTLIAMPLMLRAYKEINVPLLAQAHLIFGLPYALSFILPGRV